MKKQTAPATAYAPTTAQFTAYQAMFDYFNKTLFNGELPACILNLSRMSKALGFFAPNRWADATVETVEGQEAKLMHEISLNPDHLSRGPKDSLGTLVHEMAHLQRQVTGKPPKGGYHDKGWADMMLAVGLTPRSISAPGKMTGQKVTHDIDPGGRFEVAYEAMPKEYLLPFVHVPNLELKAKRKSSNKVKFTCPDCEANAWGKPDLNVWCGDCKCKMLGEDEEDPRNNPEGDDEEENDED